MKAGLLGLQTQAAFILGPDKRDGVELHSFTVVQSVSVHALLKECNCFRGEDKWGKGTNSST